MCISICICLFSLILCHNIKKSCNIIFNFCVSGLHICHKKVIRVVLCIFYTSFEDILSFFCIPNIFDKAWFIYIYMRDMMSCDVTNVMWCDALYRYDLYILCTHTCGTGYLSHLRGNWMLNSTSPWPRSQGILATTQVQMQYNITLYYKIVRLLL